MPIKVVVEFQAKPGARRELEESPAGISATHGPQVPGFLGSTVYDLLDTTDGLVDLAEWDSTEAQAAAVKQAMADGVYARVMELVVAPFRITRLG